MGAVYDRAFFFEIEPAASRRLVFQISNQQPLIGDFGTSTVSEEEWTRHQ
jgi:hypothetical protein